VLNTYLTLFQISWQSGLAYPLSFALWRFRQIITTVMSLTIWSVLYSQQSAIFGYDRSQMISYVFLVSLLQGAILATSLHGLAGNIYSGNISQLLIKPVNILKFLAVQDLADKCKNVLFIVLETCLLFLLFKPTLVFPHPGTLMIFLAWVGLGIIIHFWIEILFGSLGFWSPQSWGPKFVFFMLVDATAGKLFPLDILPEWLQKGLYLTPFPYLSYAQTQLFLGRLTPFSVATNTLGLLVWTFGLGWLAISVWKRGTKSYAAAGN
jgi:ABC-2 type transport system permease protein